MKNDRDLPLSSSAVYDYIRSKRDFLKKEYGNRLPTEKTLSNLLQTDRYSVRRALRKLVDHGYLYSVRNQGYYLELCCDQLPVGRGSTYHRFCETKMISPRAEIVEMSIESPRATVAEELKISGHDEVWNIFFLRYREDLRFSLTRSWIPRARTPGLIRHIRETHSLYKTLSEYYGVEATRVKTVCSAVNASAEEARLLGLPLAFALLRSESTAVDQEGTPIEHCETLFRGDVVKLEFTFPRSLE